MHLQAHRQNDCINARQQHQWKGNIRELINVMERCVILAESIELTADLLPAEIQRTTASSSKNKPHSAFELSSAEKSHIQKVLNYANGSKTKTAELLGIALTTLYRKLSEYKIN